MHGILAFKMSSWGRRHLESHRSCPIGGRESRVNSPAVEISRRMLLRLGATGALLAPHRAEAQRTAPADEDPLGVRGDFPVTAERDIYSSAYIGPIPNAVVAAGAAFVSAKAARPISLSEMQAKADQVRAQFARLVNASPDEIGFLAATSEGENLVAGALDLKPGDNVVIDELHYQTEFVLFRHSSRGAASSCGLPVIEAAPLPRRTSSRSSTGVHACCRSRSCRIKTAFATTSSRSPIWHMRTAHGLSDAIQAAGALAIDVRASEVDALCSGTYKWLHGGFGVAPFYVRRDLLDPSPRSLGRVACGAHASGPSLRHLATAKKFDTQRWHSVPCISLARRWSIWKEWVCRGLKRTPPDSVYTSSADFAIAASTYSPQPAHDRQSWHFAVPGDPGAARTVLQNAGMKVSYRENGSQIRVSPALFNTVRDVDRFVETCGRLQRG